MLYRIALTQAHSWPPARAYLARRQAEGKTRREAFRALKRYLVRAIWRLWQDMPAGAGGAGERAGGIGGTKPKMKDERGSVAPSCARLSVVVRKLYPGTGSQVNCNASGRCGWDGVRPKGAPAARRHAFHFGA